MEFHPQDISDTMGGGYSGFCLDYHTNPGHGYNGEKNHTYAGSLLYELKYFQSQPNFWRDERAATLADGIVHVIQNIEQHLPNLAHLNWNNIDLITAVPPSTPRDYQPLYALVLALEEKLKIKARPLLQVSPNVSPIKGTDSSDHFRARKGKYFLPTNEKRTLQGKTLLLVDDLFQTGASLWHCADILRRDGGAKEVLAVTATRTRKSRKEFLEELEKMYRDIDFNDVVL